MIDRAEDIVRQRRSEIFTSCMLQGAIAAARAEQSKDPSFKSIQNNRARKHFEDALAVEGFQKDLLAKECLGVQLIKLRELPRAKQVFEELYQDGGVQANPEGRAWAQARAEYN